MNDSSLPPSQRPDDAPSPDLDPEIAEFARHLQTSDDPLAKLLRPLPEEAITRIEDRVLRAPIDAPKGGQVIPLRARMRWTRWLVVAAAAALVLTFATVWWKRPHPVRIVYNLEVNGVAINRGNDTTPSNEPVHLRPSTPLKITLKPLEPVRDAALRVVIVRGPKAQIVPLKRTIESDGTISIKAPALEALGKQPDGAAKLVLLVGDHLPDDETVKRIAIDTAQEPPDGVTVMRQDLVFEDWGSTLNSIQPQDVEFAGCNAVVKGPICELAGTTTLRFWMPSLDEGLKVQLNGDDVQAKRDTIQGGTRLTVTIPPTSDKVTVVGPFIGPPFDLHLQPALDVPGLRDAFREMQKDDFAAAEKKLEVAERDSPPEVKLQALRIRARIARRKRDANAKELLQQAIEQSRTVGRVSDEMDDRYLLAYERTIVDYDFVAAERDLFTPVALEDQCSEHRVDRDYYRGVLAMEMGQLEKALHWLRRSSAGAERLDLPEQNSAARVLLGEVLSILGRHAEAHTLLERALKDSSSSADPCVHARFATTAAWVQLRAVETLEDNATAFATAMDAANLAKEKCPSALALSLLNVAFIEVQAKKTVDARAHLAAARLVAAPDDKRFQVWSKILAMDLDVLENAAQALVAVKALRAKGEKSLSPELLFGVELSSARALDALGRPEEARKAFDDAADALDVWAAVVPRGEGRETFFVQQEKGARQWVDFLVRQAETKTRGSVAWKDAVTVAADAARRSLTRFFSTWAQAEVLKKAPKDAQASLASSTSHAMDRPVATDALTLLYHPVEDGWVGFALEANGEVAMARLPPFSKEALALVESGSHSEELTKILLEPFAAELDGAKSVRVPAHGRLRRIPFEALPWKGRVLADFVTVTYGFEGAPFSMGVADAPSTCTGAPVALLVTDPKGDLPGAEKASTYVQKALASRGWSVDLLEGVSATREKTLAKLENPCTALFHYDGHAKFEGRDGLRAALVLHDGTLTVTDVLELPRVPEAVALLGCATAKDEGLGLAQAFLVRGSREVLAATEDVNDKMSMQLAEHLYDDAPSAAKGPPWLSGALNTSSAALRATSASTDAWWLFRVLAR